MSCVSKYCVASVMCVYLAAILTGNGKIFKNYEIFDHKTNKIGIFKPDMN